VNRTGTATRSPLGIADPATASWKVSWLTSIMSPSMGPDLCRAGVNAGEAVAAGLAPHLRP
jgi:hypothetical protein